MTTVISRNSDYKHLRRDLVIRWVKSLLSNKGGRKQIEFIEKTLEFNNNSNGFSAYIESEIASRTDMENEIVIGTRDPYEPAGDTVPSLASADGTEDDVISLTSAHMDSMPIADIVKLYNQWAYIPYVDASSPTLWGTITLSEVKQGRIRPVWLAVGDVGDEDKAIKKLHDETIPPLNVIDVDGLVRSVLRRMMGPPGVRGSRALFANCSLAKAWWCGRLSKECAELTNGSHEEFVGSFQRIWSWLANPIAGKLTIVRELNVACGLALWVKTQKKVRQVDVENAIQELGRQSAWSCIGLNSPEEIRNIIASRSSSPAG